MKLEAIATGQSLSGIESAQNVSVVAVVPIGEGSVQLVYRTPDGAIKERLLSRDDESSVGIATAERPFAFDGDGASFQLACEAKRIDLAFLFDPLMAVHSSNAEPLPHQITAVDESLLPRQPLRYVLADDPGAGKTIMAGLYIRELIMRADAHRIVIIAPGSLVQQWRDELYYSGSKLEKTGRFGFAEKLGAHCRHLLLMTATPHNGKEEDFRLFLSLLDSDRFYGKFRDGAHKVDASDLMRRMVKEELVKFDGTPLFPERKAYTVNYELSAIEAALYEAVTEYVKTEMGKADQLKGSGIRSDPPLQNSQKRDKSDVTWEDRAASNADGSPSGSSQPTGRCNLLGTTWHSATRPTWRGCRRVRCAPVGEAAS